MERIRKYCPLWGSWNVKRKIGEGNFGVVYEVEKTIAGNVSSSAVKLISMKNSEMLQGIRVDETMSAKELEALKLESAKKSVREAALMDKLQGRANIVTIYDYEIYPGENTTDVIIRMELLRNLNEYLAETKLDERLVIQLGIDICKALEGCEEEKIVHRDIKPANIFVNKDKKFKLGDFGLSRQMSRSASMSLRKSKGTPMYMPPEAFGWGDFVDHTSDIYTLGLVMYQLLNKGNIPFCTNIKSFEEVDRAIGKRVDRKEQIPEPENCRKELWDILKKACAYEKESRYRNATDMKKELEELKTRLDVEKAGREDRIGSKKEMGNNSFQFNFSIGNILKKAQEAWDANQFDRAFRLFEKAARLENPDAQNALGHCYYFGYGTEPDEKKALSCFEKAAVQGHKEAKKMAEVLRKQLKVEKDAYSEVPQSNPIKSKKSVTVYEVGDIVTLGSYPQDKDPLADKKPIEWLVLEKEADKMLVISKKILDCKRYQKKGEAITWESSDIRHWLNGSFYETAFNNEEQEKIQDTYVIAENNLKFGIKAGNNTKDKLFLLSINEVRKLFSSDEKRKAKPTDYAILHGVWKDKDDENSDWWLRSPGYDVDAATIVITSGYVFDVGYNVNRSRIGIRPAMWVNLEV